MTAAAANRTENARAIHSRRCSAASASAAASAGKAPASTVISIVKEALQRAAFAGLDVPGPQQITRITWDFGDNTRP